MAKYSTLLKRVIIWVVYPKLITVNLLVLSRISPPLYTDIRAFVERKQG